jgi:hypothetical protein
MAVSLVAVGMTWQWRADLRPLSPGEPGVKGVEQAKAVYALPQEHTPLPPPSGVNADAVVRANPFSKTRGELPASDQAGAAAAHEDPQPAFVYKGQILMGQRQRAILEDATTKKTHFLEVGQGVAEFKVLDMTEEQVVLSDEKTQTTLAVTRGGAQSGETKP